MYGRGDERHWPPGSFGEAGYAYPGAPTQGPFIGRGIPIGLGKRDTVIDTMTVGRIGESITLCLSVYDEKPPNHQSDPPNLDAPLVADITFGAGAGSERCRVDWLNGTLITIPAGSVKVEAEYPDMGKVDGVAVAALAQHVGCIISAGIRAPSTGMLPLARLTRRLGVVAPGELTSVVDVVPRRGHSVSLLTTDPDAVGAIELALRTTANATPRLKDARTIARVAPLTGRELPLPNGTRSIEVVNRARAPVALTLIYGIAL
jgi:hypothetical protein